LDKLINFLIKYGWLNFWAHCFEQLIFNLFVQLRGGNQLSIRVLIEFLSYNLLAYFLELLKRHCIGALWGSGTLRIKGSCFLRCRNVWNLITFFWFLGNIATYRIDSEFAKQICLFGWSWWFQILRIFTFFWFLGNIYTNRINSELA
jgi:hypothetical protein